MASGEKYNPDIERAVLAVDAMVNTDFTGDAMGLETNKEDIRNVLRRVTDRKMSSLGLARLCQV
jgi:hypothetical protein